MKAYHLEKRDDLDIFALTLRDTERPQPGSHEVLMRVHASSLNFRDLLIRNNRYLVNPKPDVVALSDAAGEVVELGSAVTRVALGERICASYFPKWAAGSLSMSHAIEQFGCTRDGMLAEYALVPEQAAIHIPDHLSYEEAACLPCAAVTAWSSLTGARGVIPGETVLTIGSGGVALFGLQLARLFGARVLSITSSSSKAELLKKLGADAVVNYNENAYWERAIRELTHGRGVDHVIETGSAQTLPKSLACTAVGGRVALVAALASSGGQIDAKSLSGLFTLQRVFVGSRDDFEAMNRAISLHALRPVVDRVFPFSEAVDAYEHFEAQRHVGKVVIAGTPDSSQRT